VDRVRQRRDKRIHREQGKDLSPGRNLSALMVRQTKSPVENERGVGKLSQVSAGPSSAHRLGESRRTDYKKTVVRTRLPGATAFVCATTIDDVCLLVTPTDRSAWHTTDSALRFSKTALRCSQSIALERLKTNRSLDHLAHRWDRYWLHTQMTCGRIEPAAGHFDRGCNGHRLLSSNFFLFIPLTRNSVTSALQYHAH
jgi:hypothetical protein